MRRLVLGIPALAIFGVLGAAQDSGTPPSQAPKAKTSPALELVRADAAEVLIPVSDLTRAKKFYEQLGCTTRNESSSYASMKGGGLQLRLVLSKEFVASDFPILVWRISSLADLKQRVMESGFQGMEQPKSKTGSREVGMSYGASTAFNVMKDPDGHVLQFVQ